MVEHAAWIGPNYLDGIYQQRVALLGYSHWGDSPDHDGFTWQCVANVRDDVWPDLRFFNSIQSYFGFDDRMSFWNRVMFFNFVPSFVGGREQRYAWATPEQRKLGQRRVIRLIREHRPSKVFVFTRKGWSSFPKTREEENDNTCLALGDNLPAAFNYGHYVHVPDRGASTIAIGLRHPQYASTAQMQSAVKAGLAL